MWFLRGKNHNFFLKISEHFDKKGDLFLREFTDRAMYRSLRGATPFNFSASRTFEMGERAVKKCLAKKKKNKKKQKSTNEAKERLISLT